MSVDKATIVADLYSINLSSAEISRLILWHGDESSRLNVISSILKNETLSIYGKKNALSSIVDLRKNDSPPSFPTVPPPTSNPVPLPVYPIHPFDGERRCGNELNNQ